MNTATNLYPAADPQTIHAAAVQVGIDQLKAIYREFDQHPDLKMGFDLDDIQHIFECDLYTKCDPSSPCDWVIQYSSPSICLDDPGSIEQLQKIITVANSMLHPKVLNIKAKPAQIKNHIHTDSALPPVVQLHSGAMLNLLAPQAHQINIQDIAHGLSHTCRFNGQCNQFYSVAQHSVIVSKFVEPQHALAALMHDAAEAFVGDLTTPLKNLLPNYQQIEQNLLKTIFQQIGLPYPPHHNIKVADGRALALEVKSLLSKPQSAQYWEFLEDFDQCDAPIFHCWAPEQAKELFLQRYYQLQTTAVTAI